MILDLNFISDRGNMRWHCSIVGSSNSFALFVHGPYVNSFLFQDQTLPVLYQIVIAKGQMSTHSCFINGSLFLKPETKRDKGTTHADSDILLVMGWDEVGGEVLLFSRCPVGMEEKSFR